MSFYLKRNSTSVPGILEAGDEEQSIRTRLSRRLSGADSSSSNENINTKPDLVQRNTDRPIRNNDFDSDADIEARMKNLSFHGIPNSIKKVNEEISPRASATHLHSASPNIDKHSGSFTPHFFRHHIPSVQNGDNNPPSPSLDNGEKQFNGWRQEFNNTFKRISVISKLKSRRFSGFRSPPAFSRRQSLMHENEPLNESEKFTQNLASDLLDSLLSGCPAALFASSQFLRDEHGRRRAPLLLAMLNVKVLPMNEADFNISKTEIMNTSTSSTSTTSSNDSSHNHVFAQTLYEKNDLLYFKIELEYGVGENRPKWVIYKSYKELISLHHKLKILAFQQNTINKLYIDQNRYHKFRIPNFPHLKYNEKVSIKNTIHKSKKKRKHKKKYIERDTSLSPASSIFNDNGTILDSMRSSMSFDLNKVKMKHLQDLINEEDYNVMPLHKRIERYLRLLNIALCLRPQSNRLFQFFEFSPLSNLLSYESGYVGKQGFLIVRSTAKAQGWRVSHFNAHDFKDMIERHTAKWFLVRHSYITYVSDLGSTTPLDVFLVDSKFKVIIAGSKNNIIDDVEDELKYRGSQKTKRNLKEDISSKFLLITIENSERKLKLFCKSESNFKQWVHSISHMARSSIWSQMHRFSSYAPVRRNAYCKYLVDGRDYFWALSEALKMAEDVIYIHDWWLSPELYMRRPIKGNQEYRIDRILKERAEYGVKIFIVVYRNVGTTVGTDSSWTKHSMLNLHPNVHLIRSPNQWLQNTYFWAHHEKFTVIDNAVAFMGGIDICFGRYDTPEHVLRDDDPDLINQIFPGKDYSNARVRDFYELEKPFESMYDRKEVPRMPWHDVHMMTCGEPARDLSRHFVQRWNYLLREKRPSRATPLLTPASDFTSYELENLPIFQYIKDRSTCEVQVLRSAGNWSLGLKETEHSIQNAYLKLIETSEHYIYIENQFFITSSSWDGVVIENKIGDAIVDRIIKANTENKPWKAFVVIPLMPGFDSPVDQPEASSLRLIMQCQYQSISRGQTSIFSRLRKLNIEPLDYIQFFSLRKWSTNGPYDKLVTEQLYVHAKLLITDDRNVIIGSANINERSQLGSRDSEVAMVVRDTDLVKSSMNNKEYYAGRFAWELRQRLMREHLGCDVDLVELVERKFNRLEHLAKKNYETLNTYENDKKAKSTDKLNSAMIELAYREIFDVKYSDLWFEKFQHNRKAVVEANGILFNDSDVLDSDPDLYQSFELNSLGKINLKSSSKGRKLSKLNKYHSFNYRAGEENKGIRDKKTFSTDPRIANNAEHEAEVNGYGPDKWKSDEFIEHKKSVTAQLHEWATKAIETRTIDKRNEIDSNYQLPEKETVELYLSDPGIEMSAKFDMLKRIYYLQHISYKSELHNKERDKFIKNNSRPSSSDIRTGSASSDDDVLDDEALDILLYQILPEFGNTSQSDSCKNIIDYKFIDPYSFEDPLAPSFYDDMWLTIALRNTLLFRLVFHCQPDNVVQTWRDYKDFTKLYNEFERKQKTVIPSDDGPKENSEEWVNENSVLPDSGLQRTMSMTVRKGDRLGDIDFSDELDDIGERAEKKLGQKMIQTNENVSRGNMTLMMKLYASSMNGFNQRIFDKITARRILERIHGHLVLFPTEWLCKEVESKNWFYHADRLPPIEIYD
ncbi:Phospholipase D1 [Nakaseomyces bracarensis]|uniref:Phospholipase n=1 Tax=Nakaseomyces bracarensis TaxID=273131 RepID=A0ABR4NMC5_9SACH